MSSINNNLKTNQVKTPSSQDLCDGFVSSLNKIFTYDNKTIKIVGTVDQPWFRAKDLIKILGYEDISTKKKLQRISSIFKKYLNEIIKVGDTVSPTSLGYNEGKEIYINEPGLYSLVMKSNLKSAENFQMFVYTELIPGIRKMNQRRYENEISSRDNKIDTLVLQNTNIIHRLESMEISQFQTQTQLDDIHSKLNDTNYKLDKALPDRNINPKDKDLNHYYILFKSKLVDNEYIFVRGQAKYIKDRKIFYKNNFDIIIDSKKNPNPIDMVNRFKEKIILINVSNYSDIINEFKCSDSYSKLSSTEKSKTILNLKKENSKILYRINKVTLLNYSEQMFIKLINELDDEKYNV